MDMNDVAEVVGDAVREAVTPLIARIMELEAREVPASIRSGMIDQAGALILTRSDGETINVGRVVGKDGADGADGRHGLQAEDVDATILEDGRTVEFSLRQGEYEYSFELGFAVPMYRGVFVEGDTYDKGDLVTWAGSLWHCNADTTDKPGGDDWTLAVKKGRDGRSAV